MIHSQYKTLSVVTGGSKGIGWELIKRLSLESDVLNISRSCYTSSHDKGSQKHVVHNLCVDIAEHDSLDEKIDEFFDNESNYHIKKLVLNAALLELGWLSDQSYNDYIRSVSTNYIGPCLLVKKLLKSDAFDKSGAAITYVTSSLARHESSLSFAGIGLYSASKAALSRIALIQARELQITHPYIKVSRVHPGIVDTDMQQELRHTDALDTRFVEKTAGLPTYIEGDWQSIMPYQSMKTITKEMSADFILWANEKGDYSATEYDYYLCDEYHMARDNRLSSGVAT